MASYTTDPAWSDLTPLPTDEGGPNPLAAIAYTPQYTETMSYLRALMAANEHSARALELTSDLIDMNPAHYTVWLYRFAILTALHSDLREEIEWLNEIALEHQKNYQIWHHRMLVVDHLGESEGEREFVGKMLERDAKNYHVWSYRQWLVKRFGLWGDGPDEGELEFTKMLILKDPRNNSAWNHRWFVINGREAEGVLGVKDEAIREREVAFAKAAIATEPQNQPPWNYLRGICKKSGMALSSLKAFVEDYASVRDPERIRSSYALDLLVEILAEEEGSKEMAALGLDLLAKKYDPVRRNYWEYRKGLLGLPSSSAAAAAS